MNDYTARPLSRDEQELLAYFRALPNEQQSDLLTAAEASFNAFERMKELAARDVERGFRDESQHSSWQ
jgi:hypothetical protein